ncbi:MAG: glycoside hydrolase family 15 protein [Candidatus Aenigmarchaeota archaeon]|nr:glycoside hydrolase family 15 protein [Candidatus Aenigmarchaeota archaeon]
MEKSQNAKNNQINILIESTKEIIKDSSLENGGIVAANTTKNNYPINAKNYFYVWPRDAAFTCIACDELKINGIQENFFNWCLNRAEGFKKNGLFYEKYYPNGLKALSGLQPDQTGSVLFALWHHYKNSPKEASKFHDLIKIGGNGICNIWKKDHFTQVTNDLWEERFCFPDLNENFSFSLAACIKGLRCANELIPNKKWINTADEMKNRLDKHFIDYFVRSYGDMQDKRIDASMIGLVYPFEIYDAKDPRIVSTIKEIEKKLLINGGIHRYEQDEYDGWMYETMHRKKGAGAWPLLNFWMSIYYSIKGDKKNAEKYYYWVLEKIKDNDCIPEQIFENDMQVSVSPLLWSHSMFALATKYLDK